MDSSINRGSKPTLADEDYEVFGLQHNGNNGDTGKSNEINITIEQAIKGMREKSRFGSAVVGSENYSDSKNIDQDECDVITFGDRDIVQHAIALPKPVGVAHYVQFDMDHTLCGYEVATAEEIGLGHEISVSDSSLRKEYIDNNESGSEDVSTEEVFDELESRDDLIEEFQSPEKNNVQDCKVENITRFVPNLSINKNVDKFATPPSLIDHKHNSDQVNSKSDIALFYESIAPSLVDERNEPIVTNRHLYDDKMPVLLPEIEIVAPESNAIPEQVIGVVHPFNHKKRSSEDKQLKDATGIAVLSNNKKPLNPPTEIISRNRIRSHCLDSVTNVPRSMIKKHHSLVLKRDTITKAIPTVLNGISDKYSDSHNAEYISNDINIPQGISSGNHFKTVYREVKQIVSCEDTKEIMNDNEHSSLESRLLFTIKNHSAKVPEKNKFTTSVYDVYDFNDDSCDGKTEEYKNIRSSYLSKGLENNRKKIYDFEEKMKNDKINNLFNNAHDIPTGIIGHNERKKSLRRHSPNNTTSMPILMSPTRDPSPPPFVKNNKGETSKKSINQDVTRKQKTVRSTATPLRSFQRLPINELSQTLPNANKKSTIIRKNSKLDSSSVNKPIMTPKKINAITVAPVVQDITNDFKDFGIDLLERELNFDPCERVTRSSARKKEYLEIKTEPLMKDVVNKQQLNNSVMNVNSTDFIPFEALAIETKENDGSFLTFDNLLTDLSPDQSTNPLDDSIHSPLFMKDIQSSTDILEVLPGPDILDGGVADKEVIISSADVLEIKNDIVEEVQVPCLDDGTFSTIENLFDKDLSSSKTVKSQQNECITIPEHSFEKINQNPIKESAISLEQANSDNIFPVTNSSFSSIPVDNQIYNNESKAVEILRTIVNEVHTLNKETNVRNNKSICHLANNCDNQPISNIMGHEDSLNLDILSNQEELSESSTTKLIKKQGANEVSTNSRMSDPNCNSMKKHKHKIQDTRYQKKLRLGRKVTKRKSGNKLNTIKNFETSDDFSEISSQIPTSIENKVSSASVPKADSNSLCRRHQKIKHVSIGKLLKKFDENVKICTNSTSDVVKNDPENLKDSLDENSTISFNSNVIEKDQTQNHSTAEDLIGAIEINYARMNKIPLNEKSDSGGNRINSSDTSNTLLTVIATEPSEAIKKMESSDELSEISSQIPNSIENKVSSASVPEADSNSIYRRHQKIKHVPIGKLLTKLDKNVKICTNSTSDVVKNISQNLKDSLDENSTISFNSNVIEKDQTQNHSTAEDLIGAIEINYARMNKIPLNEKSDSGGNRINSSDTSNTLLTVIATEPSEAIKKMESSDELSEISSQIPNSIENKVSSASVPEADSNSIYRRHQKIKHVPIGKLLTKLDKNVKICTNSTSDVVKNISQNLKDSLDENSTISFNSNVIEKDQTQNHSTAEDLIGEIKINYLQSNKIPLNGKSDSVIATQPSETSLVKMPESDSNQKKMPNIQVLVEVNNLDNCNQQSSLNKKILDVSSQNNKVSELNLTPECVRDVKKSKKTDIIHDTSVAHLNKAASNKKVLNLKHTKICKSKTIKSELIHNGVVGTPKKLKDPQPNSKVEITNEYVAGKQIMTNTEALIENKGSLAPNKQLKSSDETNFIDGTLKILNVSSRPAESSADSVQAIEYESISASKNKDILSKAIQSSKSPLHKKPLESKERKAGLEYIIKKLTLKSEKHKNNDKQLSKTCQEAKAFGSAFVDSIGKIEIDTDQSKSESDSILREATDNNSDLESVCHLETEIIHDNLDAQLELIYVKNDNSFASTEKFEEETKFNNQSDSLSYSVPSDTISDNCVGQLHEITLESSKININVSEICQKEIVIENENESNLEKLDTCKLTESIEGKCDQKIKTNDEIAINCKIVTINNETVKSNILKEGFKTMSAKVTADLVEDITDEIEKNQNKYLLDAVESTTEKSAQILKPDEPQPRISEVNDGIVCEKESQNKTDTVTLSLAVSQEISLGYTTVINESATEHQIEVPHISSKSLEINRGNYVAEQKLNSNVEIINSIEIKEWLNEKVPKVCDVDDGSVKNKEYLQKSINGLNANFKYPNVTANFEQKCNKFSSEFNNIEGNQSENLVEQNYYENEINLKSEKISLLKSSTEMDHLKPLTSQDENKDTLKPVNESDDLVEEKKIVCEEAIIHDGPKVNSLIFDQDNRTENILEKTRLKSKVLNCDSNKSFDDVAADICEHKELLSSSQATECIELAVIVLNDNERNPVNKEPEESSIKNVDKLFETETVNSNCEVPESSSVCHQTTDEILENRNSGADNKKTEIGDDDETLTGDITDSDLKKQFEEDKHTKESCISQVDQLPKEANLPEPINKSTDDIDEEKLNRIESEGPIKNNLLSRLDDSNEITTNSTIAEANFNCIAANTSVNCRELDDTTISDSNTVNESTFHNSVSGTSNEKIYSANSNNHHSNSKEWNDSIIGTNYSCTSQEQKYSTNDTLEEKVPNGREEVTLLEKLGSVKESKLVSESLNIIQASKADLLHEEHVLTDTGIINQTSDAKIAHVSTIANNPNDISKEMNDLTIEISESSKVLKDPSFDDCKTSKESSDTSEKPNESIVDDIDISKESSNTEKKPNHSIIYDIDISKESSNTEKKPNDSIVDDIDISKESSNTEKKPNDSIVDDIDISKESSDTEKIPNDSIVDDIDISKELSNTAKKPNDSIVDIDISKESSDSTLDNSDSSKKPNDSTFDNIDIPCDSNLDNSDSSKKPNDSSLDNSDSSKKPNDSTMDNNYSCTSQKQNYSTIDNNLCDTLEKQVPTGSEAVVTLLRKLESARESKLVPESLNIIQASKADLLHEEHLLTDTVIINQTSDTKIAHVSTIANNPNDISKEMNDLTIKISESSKVLKDPTFDDSETSKESSVNYSIVGNIDISKESIDSTLDNNDISKERNDSSIDNNLGRTSKENIDSTTDNVVSDIIVEEQASTQSSKEPNNPSIDNVTSKYPSNSVVDHSDTSKKPNDSVISNNPGDVLMEHNHSSVDDSAKSNELINSNDISRELNDSTIDNSAKSKELCDSAFENHDTSTEQNDSTVAKNPSDILEENIDPNIDNSVISKELNDSTIDISVISNELIISSKISRELNDSTIDNGAISAKLIDSSIDSSDTSVEQNDHTIDNNSNAISKEPNDCTCDNNPNDISKGQVDSTIINTDTLLEKADSTVDSCGKSHDQNDFTIDNNESDSPKEPNNLSDTLRKQVSEKSYAGVVTCSERYDIRKSEIVSEILNTVHNSEINQYNLCNKSPNEKKFDKCILTKTATTNQISDAKTNNNYSTISNDGSVVNPLSLDHSTYSRFTSSHRENISSENNDHPSDIFEKDLKKIAVLSQNETPSDKLESDSSSSLISYSVQCNSISGSSINNDITIIPHSRQLSDPNPNTATIIHSDGNSCRKLKAPQKILVTDLNQNGNSNSSVKTLGEGDIKQKTVETCPLQEHTQNISQKFNYDSPLTNMMSETKSKLSGINEVPCSEKPKSHRGMNKPHSFSQEFDIFLKKDSKNVPKDFVRKIKTSSSATESNISKDIVHKSINIASGFNTEQDEILQRLIKEYKDKSKEDIKVHTNITSEENSTNKTNVTNNIKSIAPLTSDEWIKKYKLKDIRIKIKKIDLVSQPCDVMPTVKSNVNSNKKICQLLGQNSTIKRISTSHDINEPPKKILHVKSPAEDPHLVLDENKSMKITKETSHENSGTLETISSASTLSDPDLNTGTIIHSDGNICRKLKAPQKLDVKTPRNKEVNLNFCCPVLPRLGRFADIYKCMDDHKVSRVSIPIIIYNSFKKTDGHLLALRPDLEIICTKPVERKTRYKRRRRKVSSSDTDEFEYDNSSAVSLAGRTRRRTSKRTRESKRSKINQRKIRVVSTDEQVTNSQTGQQEQSIRVHGLSSANDTSSSRTTPCERPISNEVMSETYPKPTNLKNLKAHYSSTCSSKEPESVLLPTAKENLLAHKSPFKIALPDGSNRLEESPTLPETVSTSSSRSLEEVLTTENMRELLHTVAKNRRLNQPAETSDDEEDSDDDDDFLGYKDCQCPAYTRCQNNCYITRWKIKHEYLTSTIVLLSRKTNPCNFRPSSGEEQDVCRPNVELHQQTSCNFRSSNEESSSKRRGIRRKNEEQLCQQTNAKRFRDPEHKKICFLSVGSRSGSVVKNVKQKRFLSSQDGQSELVVAVKNIEERRPSPQVARRAETSNSEEDASSEGESSESSS